MTTGAGAGRHETEAAMKRVLIAVHGHEPGGWGPQACRLLPMWPDSIVRILVVLAVPRPAFTSLTRPARRAYEAARAEWHRQQEARTRNAVDAVLRVLPGKVEVVGMPASQGDPGRTIAQYARDWPADVVVVGTHTPRSLAGHLLGAVHERVVRYATCAVFVTPAPATTRAGRRKVKVIPVPRPILHWRRPVDVHPGA